MIHRAMLASGTLLALVGSLLAQTQPILPSPRPLASEDPAPVPRFRIPEPADSATVPPPSTPDPASCPATPIETAEPEARKNHGWWIEGEYLLTFYSGDHLPILVTTGALGAAGTHLIFGGDDVNTEMRSGLRLEAGHTLTPDGCIGIEGGFTLLESHSTIFAMSSNGSPVLAEPFIDQATGTQQAAIIATAGTPGTVDIRAQSGNYYEGNIDLSENVVSTNCMKMDVLFGYRLYSYDEALENRTTTTATTSSRFVPGSEVVSEDDFRTRNNFNGVDMGLRGRWCEGHFSLDLETNVAVGKINREVNIVGGTLVTVPGSAPAPHTGGLYALASNIGTHPSDEVTALPEFRATYGCQLGCHCRLSVGYSLTCLCQVARAADQIDQTINTNLLPPSTTTPAATDHPAFQNNRSNLWIQAVSLGAEYKY